MLFFLIRPLLYLAIAAAVFYALSRWHYQGSFVARGFLPKRGVSEARYSRFLDGVDPAISTDEHKAMVRRARWCRSAAMTVFLASLALALLMVFLGALARFL